MLVCIWKYTTPASYCLESSFSFFLPGPKWSTLSKPKHSIGQAKCGRSMAQKKQSKARDYTQITKIKYFRPESCTEEAGFKRVFYKGYSVSIQSKRITTACETQAHKDMDRQRGRERQELTLVACLQPVRNWQVSHIIINLC